MKTVATMTLAESISTIVAFLLECAILMWVCAVLLPAFPWLAVLAGFTYWDWVAVNFGIRWAIRTLRSIFHK